MMDYPRRPFSELHLGKFPYSLDFECCKVNIKIGVCADSPRLTITMPWIKEVERATSIDDPMTSQSNEG